MKKVLSCALIVSMLSTTGAMCFAQETKEVSKEETVLSHIESTEELGALVDKVKTEIENNDQLREQIEALSKDAKEDGGICSSIKSWFQNIVGVPYRKAVDFLSNNVLLREAVDTLSNAAVTTLSFHVISLPWYALTCWFGGYKVAAEAVVVGSFIGSGIYAYGEAFVKWIRHLMS